mmetsp:Transcript_8514/g.24170  ORF Transcript_8514/g.24170 Transcript_8514/m.24170 type:complete len:97 (+) Transcript_8514:1207-1497(+)
MGAPAALAVASIKPAASGARSPVVFWSSSSELMASSAELELSLESSRSISAAAFPQRLRGEAALPASPRAPQLRCFPAKAQLGAARYARAPLRRRS